MLRRLGAILAVVLALATPTASAQFDENAGFDEPASDPTPFGRTPRQPRSSTADDPPDAQDPLPVDELPRGEIGGTPPAPVGVARSRVRSRVETEQRAVALTLDDGYRPDPRILELIESYGIHGTAFIVGEVADSDPSLLNDLARLGWLVCSHTYDHELLTGRSLEAIRSQIVRGVEAVERVVGYRCPYVRAPYGAVDANVAAVTDELGLELIGWEASLSDSAPAGTDPELQLSIAQQDIRPGSIVLGHFGATNSYEVLSRLLAWLADEGYSVGSVTELIDGNTKQLVQIGSAAVRVDLPAAAAPRAAGVLPTGTGGPMSFAGIETTFELLGVAALITLVRRRWIFRRRRRITPSTAVPVLRDTVPPWETTSTRDDAPLVGG